MKTIWLGLCVLALLFAASCGGKGLKFRVVDGCELRPNTVCRGASLIGENLTGLDLSGSDFRESDFSGTNLSGVNFSQSNLSGGIFVSANMAGTNCTGADLSDADLSDANITSTVWGDTICPDGTNSDEADGTCRDHLGEDPDPDPNPDPNPDANPDPVPDQNPDMNPEPDPDDEICDDGADNDLDRLIDCDDGDCSDDPACSEVCDDGVDNDLDEFTDCEDFDCDGDPACVEVCDDEIDNDLDEFIDCEDFDCSEDPACEPFCGNGDCEEGETFESCPDDCEDPGCETPNECNGCEVLEGAVGDPCGTCGAGALVCDGEEALICQGDPGDQALNQCGGCEELDARLEAPCGPCGLGEIVCEGENDVTCDTICGNVCESDDDCVVGECSNGHCVLPDFAYLGQTTFTMGSPDDELGSSDDEVEHEVTLTKAAMMMRTEVTQGAYSTLMGGNPSTFDACGAACPVESISFASALAYANALSDFDALPRCYTLRDCTGDPAEGDLDCAAIDVIAPGENVYLCPGYRLPTEAEWEYAARGGAPTAFYNGAITETGCDPIDPNLDAIGWFCGNAAGIAHVVGQKAENPFGLFDVIGNVSEWVWDFYGDYPTEPVTDPMGPETGEERVFRGGSWFDDAGDCRLGIRVSTTPGDHTDTLGFRLVQTIEWPLDP